MRKGAFSRTALAACALREVHLRLDAPRVFSDPIAAQLLGRRRRGILRLPNWAFAADKRGLGILHCARGHIVSRSAYAEGELQRALRERSIQRYLILGAGLDSFAWRRPEWAKTLPVTEIDFAATQVEKRRRVEGLGDPAPLDYLDVDFTTESLSEKLAATPGISEKPSFVSWLGVTPYLPPEAVISTLRDLKQILAPGSILVMDFVGGYKGRELFRKEAFGAGVMAAWVAARGEPFQFRGQSLKSQRAAWKGAGWDIAELLTEPEVNRRFFTMVGSPLRTIPGTGLVQLVRA